MQQLRFRNAHVQLGLVFFVLVLCPSFLLGYFSLRAVENERVAASERLRADRAGYAELAGRAVHQELQALETAWKALVPRRVGWERRPGDTTAAVGAAEGRAFVHAAHLLHVSGDRLYPPGALGSEVSARTLVTGEAARLQELLVAGETAEFDAGEAEAALAAYGELLAASPPPRLGAIALAGIGRAHLRLGQADAALAAFQRVLSEHAGAYDLDNQPLRLQARLQIARILAERNETLRATEELVVLYEDLVAHSDAIGRLQYDIFVERLEERLGHLLPRPLTPAWQPLQERINRVRGQPKKVVGSEYFGNKLSRKLVRAALDGLAYSTEVRYLSDSVDDRPFLLAYLYLPDASGTAVAGLVGFEIDLEDVARSLLPGLLQHLEPPQGTRLLLLDSAGKEVPGGEAPPAHESRSLDVPFDFWSVAVAGSEVAAGADFRTKVFLYFVLLLLVTLAAGAFLVVAGLRRESRLANLQTGLVSSVSHELRTPLTSIRMYIEMLETASAEQRSGYLQTIRRECDRLQRLVDRVLDFARSERGTRRWRFEFEEVGALVHSAAEDFRTQAEAGGFRYGTEIEPDLPELRLDADAIRQMLLNLLANAVQYSEAERHIVVRAYRRHREVAVEVQDHGIGIAPGDKRHIFDDFYRGDSRLSSRHGGIGLGLALVRRVVAAHGARIDVESERGRGSTFTVWLPVPEEASGGQTAGEVGESGEARRG